MAALSSSKLLSFDEASQAHVPLSLETIGDTVAADKWSSSINDYKLMERIGKHTNPHGKHSRFYGSQAAVYRARFTESAQYRYCGADSFPNCEFAIKIIYSTEACEPEMLLRNYQMEMEVSKPSRILHHHIARMFHHFIDTIPSSPYPPDWEASSELIQPEAVFMIFELFSFSLKQLITHRSSLVTSELPSSNFGPLQSVDVNPTLLTETKDVVDETNFDDEKKKYESKWMVLLPNEVLVVLHHITSALCYLHTHRIAHRDIKPDNIMFRIPSYIDKFDAMNDLTCDPDIQVVLCDFGECYDFKLANKTAMTLRYEYDMRIGGAPAYLPPEITSVKCGDILNYDKSDIWSLGAVLAGMMSGSPDIVLRTLKKSNSTFADHFDTTLYGTLATLLNGMLKSNPSERLSCYDTYLRVSASKTGPSLTSLHPAPISLLSAGESKRSSTSRANEAETRLNGFRYELNDEYLRLIEFEEQKSDPVLYDKELINSNGKNWLSYDDQIFAHLPDDFTLLDFITDPQYKLFRFKSAIEPKSIPRPDKNPRSLIGNGRTIIWWLSLYIQYNGLIDDIPTISSGQWSTIESLYYSTHTGLLQMAMYAAPRCSFLLCQKSLSDLPHGYKSKRALWEYGLANGVTEFLTLTPPHEIHSDTITLTISQLADNGNAEAIVKRYRSGRTWRPEGETANYPLCNSLLLRVIENSEDRMNRMISLCEYARSFEHGWGCDIDYEYAILLYQQAIAHGNGNAYYHLWRLYIRLVEQQTYMQTWRSHGPDLPLQLFYETNFAEEAKKLLHRSCELIELEVSANCWLGYYYAVVHPSDDKATCIELAMKHYTRASELGHSSAATYCSVLESGRTPPMPEIGRAIAVILFDGPCNVQIDSTYEARFGRHRDTVNSAESLPCCRAARLASPCWDYMPRGQLVLHHSSLRGCSSTWRFSRDPNVQEGPSRLEFAPLRSYQLGRIAEMALNEYPNESIYSNYLDWEFGIINSPFKLKQPRDLIEQTYVCLIENLRLPGHTIPDQILSQTIHYLPDERLAEPPELSELSELQQGCITS